MEEDEGTKRWRVGEKRGQGEGRGQGKVPACNLFGGRSAEGTHLIRSLEFRVGLVRGEATLEKDQESRGGEDPGSRCAIDEPQSWGPPRTIDPAR